MGQEDWSYFSRGKLVGPMSEDRLLLAIEQGVVTPGTLVYTSEFGENLPENWKQLRETEFAEGALGRESRDTRPQVQSARKQDSTDNPAARSSFIRYDDEKDVRDVRIQAPTPLSVVGWLVRFILWVILGRIILGIVLIALLFGLLTAGLYFESRPAPVPANLDYGHMPLECRPPNHCP
jgi:hypothetical protein